MSWNKNKTCVGCLQVSSCGPFCGNSSRILGSTFGEPPETAPADLAQPKLLLDFEVVTLKILDACKHWGSADKSSTTGLDALSQSILEDSWLGHLGSVVASTYLAHDFHVGLRNNCMRSMTPKHLLDLAHEIHGQDA